MQTRTNHSSFGKAGFRKEDVQLDYIFRKLWVLSLYITQVTDEQKNLYLS